MYRINIHFLKIWHYDQVFKPVSGLPQNPTEQCSNSAPKIYFSYVSWLRWSQQQCWQMLFFRVWNWLFQEWKQSLQEQSWRSTQFWTIWPLQICKSSLQLADLDQSLNLGFILLDKNNPRIRKSPPNLNIAPWENVKTVELIQYDVALWWLWWLLLPYITQGFYLICSGLQWLHKAFFHALCSPYYIMPSQQHTTSRIKGGSMSLWRSYIPTGLGLNFCKLCKVLCTLK